MAFSAGANNIPISGYNVACLSSASIFLKLMFFLFSSLIGSGAITFLRIAVVAFVLHVRGTALANNSLIYPTLSQFTRENQRNEGFLMWSMIVVLITATHWLGVATYFTLPVSSQQSMQAALNKGYRAPLWSKVQHKHEENAHLRAENMRCMEALSNASCLNCCGPTPIPETSFHDQQLVIENARLRQKEKWSNVFSFVVSIATNLQVILPGVGGSYNGATIVANSYGGVDSTSAYDTKRGLGPRKEDKVMQGHSHFYEILPGDLDPHWCLNRRIIKVFWALGENWYHGLVSDYHPESKLHHVKYDDWDEEWIDLEEEKFKLLLFSDEVPGRVKSRKVTAKDKGEHKGEAVPPEDDASCKRGYLDSELSWLTRSSKRGKSSKTSSDNSLVDKMVVNHLRTHTWNHCNRPKHTQVRYTLPGEGYDFSTKRKMRNQSALYLVNNIGALA